MLKLPSSLKWLIERRGRIDGSIQKIELYLNRNQRVFEKYQELTSELSLLKETLISIDTTLRLHKLQIDPDNIPAIHGKNYLTDLPRGDLSVMISEKIGMANGLPVSSKEIVDFVIERRLVEGAAPIPRTTLSLQVKRRMNGLYHQGKLIRHHPQKTQHCGWWTLAVDTTHDIRAADDVLEHNL